MKQQIRLRSIIPHLLYASLFLLIYGQEVETGSLSLSQPLILKWGFKTDLSTGLTPATDGINVFFPLVSGGLVSINTRDGQLNWRTDLGGEISASPVADERSVYVCTEPIPSSNTVNQAKGAIRALGREGGITQWMRTLPMPIRGTLIVSRAYLYGGSSDGRVYAFKKETGDVVWIMQHSAGFASIPSIYGQTLYLGSGDGYLFSLDSLTGKINWRYRTRGAIRGRATVVDGFVYFGSSDGYVYAVAEADGRFRWRKRTGAGVQTVANAPKGLLVASLDNFAYLLSYGNGDIQWKRQLPGRLNTEPLMAENEVLFTPLSSSVGVALDLKSGKQVNNLPIGDDNEMVASPIRIGSFIFLSTRHGLLAFSAPS